MANNQRVTVWRSVNPITNESTHNHIEVGVWQTGSKPAPKFPTQNCWNKMLWKKQFGYMVDRKIVY